jgi:acetylornithine deacetylase/succinyl-diaminopimelate desuccinylase-like protein
MDRALVDRLFEADALPALDAYTRIPCLSPAFDADWASAGHLRRAADLLAEWCRTRPLAGMTVDVLELPGRTPVLLVEIEGDAPGSVLLYGHLDKQPPQGEWLEGLGPYTPVRRGDLFFGRGTADDGYSVFAALTALQVAAATGAPLPRVAVLIEASEESGSPDLPAHLEALSARIGRPDLVVCLDSGGLTYDRLWRTSSLRGNVVATVRVEVLTEGVHSGLAGGLVPSSFRLLRRLLSRIEDERTGEILLPELRAEVPAAVREQIRALVAELPGAAADDLPTVDGLVLAGNDDAERLINRSWSTALALTGMDGIPSVRDGGNVLRPFTEAKCSIRLPPTVDAAKATDALVAALSADPPEGATVTVEVEPAADGWLAPDPAPWVAEALDRASLASFGRTFSTYGEGGSIPFLPALAEQFPGIQLIATGVLGPGSNAHGPNEALHLPMAKAVTLAVAELVAATPAGRNYPAHSGD